MSDTIIPHTITTTNYNQLDMHASILTCRHLLYSGANVITKTLMPVTVYLSPVKSFSLSTETLGVVNDHITTAITGLPCPELLSVITHNRSVENNLITRCHLGGVDYCPADTHRLAELPYYPMSIFFGSSCAVYEHPPIKNILSFTAIISGCVTFFHQVFIQRLIMPNSLARPYLTKYPTIFAFCKVI